MKQEPFSKRGSLNKVQNKKWQIADKAGKDFENLFSHYSLLTKQLLWNRNLKEKKEIEEFLQPDFFAHTHDPFLFQDMEKSINTIISHIKEQNLIYIYGDYDADGVTSTALLFETLTLLKAKVDIYIPHRVLEGYGMNGQAIEYIHNQGAKLIITVDGGIRNKAEVSLAKEKGIGVILTDHHIAPDEKVEYPDCPVINPVVKDEKYPYRDLVGVGVAYKLAKALLEKSTLESADKQRIEEQMLDLVAIGTVADCAKLRGENRVLVKKGLESLSKTKRHGLEELIKISAIKNPEKIDAWNIGFQIAPRLNAAGRLDHANTAYKLLVSKDRREARRLAAELNLRNQERQNHTAKLFEAVDEQIKNQKDNKLLIGVCPENATDNPDDWNEGVIGLVAGRITQKYALPSLVYTKSKNGYKASGRSTPGFDLIAAIERNSSLLEKYGGHPAACGISVSEDNLSPFNKQIVDYVNEEMKATSHEIVLSIEAMLDFSDLSEEAIADIQAFAPFGNLNLRPVLASKNVQVLDIQYMGAENQHIKFRLKSQDSKAISALAFSEAKKWSEIKIGDQIDIAYYLELNEFNGRREVQIKVVDIALSKRQNS